MTAIARAKGIDLAGLEAWVGDEARIGQKNKLTRRWAKRGTRSSTPQDQRPAATYIFGAICAKKGKGAALLLGQAGWHVSAKLLVSEDITIVPLPAKCPELNPQENIWQFMRDNWLSNRVFTCCDNLVEHCCAAWN